jgi:hypothetical protein
VIPKKRSNLKAIQTEAILEITAGSLSAHRFLPSRERETNKK